MDPHFDWIAVGSGAQAWQARCGRRNRGLKAIVIEKAPVVGGATAYSYGGLWAPDNMLQAPPASTIPMSKGSNTCAFFREDLLKKRKCACTSKRRPRRLRHSRK